MKSISGKEFTRVLEKHGWKLLRIHSSHHIYAKPGEIQRISVPVHGSTPLKIGLLKHFLKIAGLSENEL
jgi:predicted RNA binding protein YcfA (HicA-like mRNA interferase family)